MNSIAVTELDGRPVIAVPDRFGVMWICDLTAGESATSRSRIRTGLIEWVASAEIGGRQMIVSGAPYTSVDVWDLATGQSLYNSFTRAAATTGMQPRQHWQSSLAVRWLSSAVRTERLPCRT